MRPKERPSFIRLFAASQKEFLQFNKQIEMCLSGNVSFWVSWYKKNSGITTNLNEDWIRQFALAHNLVDVKVCAVTEQWSGLKLVIPVGRDDHNFLIKAKKVVGILKILMINCICKQQQP